MDFEHARPFSKYFDHTLLKADAGEDDIRRLVREAVEHDFAAVCVNGCYVGLASECLKELSPGSAPTDSASCGVADGDLPGSGAPCAGTGSGTADGNLPGSDASCAGTEAVKIAAVVGFPLGASSAEAKAFETEQAIEDGASEIDMVINIGAAKDGRWDYVENEICRLAEICHGRAGKVILKVILETCLLTDGEIEKACQISCRAGADFVKTSTGFSTGGASQEAVRLMKKAAGPSVMVKASGGIRTLDDAKKMIEAGADRIGCSASVDIMKDYERS